MNAVDVNIFKNPLGLLPTSREVFEAFLDIPISTFSIILGIIFWLGLLYIPLTAIDRRDQIAGLTYATFMCFAGTLLILGLGGPYAGRSAVFTNILVCIVVYGIAKFRWLNRTPQKSINEIFTEEGSA